jgi:hypothetical protein
MGERSMKKESPIAFAMNHIDSCPSCTFGDFCDSGRALMRRAAQIAAEIILPIPVETKNKA